MILQMVLGGLAAAAVFLKLFWHRLLVFLRIRKPLEPASDRSRRSSAPVRPVARTRSRLETTLRRRGAPGVGRQGRSVALRIRTTRAWPRTPHRDARRKAGRFEASS
jgi:hypothetical protein